MKAFICSNLKKNNSMDTVSRLCKELNALGSTPMMAEEFDKYFSDEKIVFGNEEQLIKECDLLITVGGDGTILKWGRKAAAANKPLLGINTGRLGFMATLECDELHKLKKLADGDYSISRRMLLDVTVAGQTYIAVNDIVFSKSRFAKLPEFAVSTGDFEVTKIRADGIIFSTPTGSTAYSLSAGGPIIQPDAECIEFTPLCAHTLFGRPMIFSAGSDLKVSFSGYENSEVILSIDGDDDINIVEGETVSIRKSDLVLNLIDIDGGSFYEAVHNKLMRPLK
ncbi:MAG: NAD(+)/NADH kinase [Eubacterium sp.]|nr:NAD(+)/NADH kinase [Eubacterium sp.]